MTDPGRTGQKKTGQQKMTNKPDNDKPADTEHKEQKAPEAKRTPVGQKKPEAPDAQRPQKAQKLQKAEGSQKTHKARKEQKQRRGIPTAVLVVLAAGFAALLCGLLLWQRGIAGDVPSETSRETVSAVSAASAAESAASSGDAASASSAYTSAAEDGQEVISYQGKSYVYNDDIDHYLFLGIDSSENISDTKYAGKNGQSDAIFLVSYNRREATMQLLAIPRDTITEIETFSPDGDSLGVTSDHISLQYAYGDGKFKSCELSAKAVSHLLYGLKIRGYCSLNLSSMGELADLVGGVTVTVPDESLANADPPLHEGDQVTITRDNAEEFLRYRDTGETGSALDRQNRQITFLKAFGQKVQEEQQQDAGTAARIYQGLEPYMVTNIDKGVFIQMASAGGDHNVTVLPGEAGKDGEYDAWEVDDTALYEWILQNFYKEAQG